MGKVTLIPAYVVHSKPYRNTSLLVDLFTRDKGFIKTIAKGVRTHSIKKNNKMGLIQPFCLLLISLAGKSSLLILKDIELAEQPIYYSRTQLSLAYYLNELLYYLCANSPGVSNNELFNKYYGLLYKIRDSKCFVINNTIDLELELELSLRNFELDLLDSIGYGLQFGGIKSDLYYSYSFEDGFYVVTQNKTSYTNNIVIKGSNLLDIKFRNWQDNTTILVAKKLLRSIISHYLSGKQLYSRKLLFVD